MAMDEDGKTMTLWYGGDYNPEQWPREVWDEDVALMRRGGITMATVGVFSWARLEPRPGEFDFAWLDEILDLLHANGVRVDLATATASPPPWLAAAHPETLPVTEDGVRLSPGSRQHYCPSSPVFRAHAVRLAAAMADRYAGHPAVELWHIGNEYGCHVSRCYCEVSAEAFRRWLRDRYGTVDALNTAWGTDFWSQRYGSFDEVRPPRAAPSFRNPTQLLDFDRFGSDELLACYLAEKAVLRERTDAPVTTNFMGPFKGVDYWRWAQEVDVVSDDLYPDPADPRAPWDAAMARDLMRSLGGGAPWILMEQAPSAVNWRPHNAVKAPGMMRAWSYQAVARGADGVLFFQWRQSAAGAEKFHSGLVPHSGTDTRVWREVAQLGAELGRLSGRIAGSRVRAEVAIAFDWDSWWAIEQEASPTTTSYLAVLAAWHRALTAQGVAVDFVRSGGDLSGYRLVVVPAHMVLTPQQGENLAAFAARGGTLAVGCATGIVDENLRVHLGGYLGAALREALGVWIEEIAPPAPVNRERRPDAAPPTVALAGDVLTGARRRSEPASASESTSGRREYGPATALSAARHTLAAGEGDGPVGWWWAEYARVESAEPLAVFAEGALAGWPAVTRRAHGEGGAWYVATLPEDDALRRLAGALLADAGVRALGPVATGGAVEAVERGELLFLINHGGTGATLDVDGTDILTGESARGLVLEPQGVAIVEGT